MHGQEKAFVRTLGSTMPSTGDDPHVTSIAQKFCLPSLSRMVTVTSIGSSRMASMSDKAVTVNSSVPSGW